MTDVELNAAVARMMGWFEYGPTWRNTNGYVIHKKDWSPATNIAQAMEDVVGALESQGLTVTLHCLIDRTMVAVNGQFKCHALVETDKPRARAICLAALAAHNAREGTTREVTT